MQSWAWCDVLQPSIAVGDTVIKNTETDVNEEETKGTPFLPSATKIDAEEKIDDMTTKL